ncbi:hypothetical protein OG753_04235 [Streptomyces sp. NBC_00029]|uniref:hypothetical protein n=1 Tax=Streptomyces sp. NBC_00029 TaxID=2903613 RepID=UPI00324DA55B
MGGAGETAEEAYAAALREAVKDYIASGGTKVALAKATGVEKSSLSRYLSGQRVAPRKAMNAIRAHLERESFTFPDGFWENLDELCGKAHLACKQVRQLEEEKERLARACAEHERARRTAEGRQHRLERVVGRLAENLRQARGREGSAEGVRLNLQTRVAVQDRSLRKAGDYIRGIETELEEQKAQTGGLEGKVAKLQEQNRRLVEENAAIAALPTQVSEPQYVYITLPHRAEPVPMAATVPAAAAVLPWSAPAPVLPQAWPPAHCPQQPTSSPDPYGQTPGLPPAGYIEDTAWTDTPAHTSTGHDAYGGYGGYGYNGYGGYDYGGYSHNNYGGPDHHGGYPADAGYAEAWDAIVLGLHTTADVPDGTGEQPYSGADPVADAEPPGLPAAADRPDDAEAAPQEIAEGLWNEVGPQPRLHPTPPPTAIVLAALLWAALISVIATTIRTPAARTLKTR